MIVNNILDQIRQTGVVAILRARSAEQLLDAAKAIHLGGIQAIEVTLTTLGALDLVEKAVAQFSGEVAFGAGTVLDAENARLAIQAGAQFIVSPGLKLEVIEVCKRFGIPVLPGAYTPTEIIAAWDAGADLVKLFPASLGGPALVKALKAPLPQIELVPVGGVNLENTAQFIQAGAAAVGVGSELLDARLLAAQDWPALTQRARQFIEEVHRGRGL